MQLLKRFPFLIGWLSFVLSTWLFQWLVGLIIIPYVSISVLLASYAFISLPTFSLSISMIALPLYRQKHNTVINYNRIKFPSVLIRWILVFVYYLVYCVPLSIKGLLPENIKDPLAFVWQIIASFLAYHVVVRAWFDDSFSHSQQNNEKKVLAT